MTKAGANGATELLYRQVPPRWLRWTQPKQHPDHAEKARSVDPERNGKAEIGKDHTANGRANGPADVDANAARSDRTLQALRRNELRNDRLPGGGLECADCRAEE